MKSEIKSKKRGSYSSPLQAKRRDRILSETLKLLESGSPSDISMALIAERSEVTPKTLYNLFGNRNGLLMEAASLVNRNNQISVSEIDGIDGVTRIFELTRRALNGFVQSPEFMESTMTLVITMTAEEEAEHHRITRVQTWFYEALKSAESSGELLSSTDCLELSQILTASQWGAVLLWQKHLISMEALRRQTVMKHCTDLMCHCKPEVQRWLQQVHARPEQIESFIQESINNRAQ